MPSCAMSPTPPLSTSTPAQPWQLIWSSAVARLSFGVMGYSKPIH